MTKTDIQISGVPLVGTITYSNLVRVSGVGGTAALTAGGVFSFDTAEDFDGLASGETEALEFSFLATAPSGTHNGSIAITVEGDTTAAALKTLYESNADTNAFTDADHTKLDAISAGGFADYNNTIAGQSVLADTWHTMPNDGQGAFTNTASMPDGVTSLLDAATGALDPSQLSIGDALLIRNDFTVTPSINNSLFEFRYKLGSGAGEYTLPKTPFRLNRGAGIADRIVTSLDYVYMGDENTRGNLVYLQVKCSAQFSVINQGSAIQVIRRG